MDEKKYMKKKFIYMKKKFIKKHYKKIYVK